ncbi:TIGR03016 family PEP-CTERM system-associated outer membrane protein [Vibrio hannami]|uniref:TIGR03016 family PEP-CTERM system-associated outer membrane protein n=1 Tax=Vibrio hannami TaxID=2717094 RepID=UPI00240EA669|nr:TIGR03016 family PEP-CTERM system-associated outer membrane protein [Vibrio hannami]MDG3088265.1 TIGR03016 family PEP-CTERM system-associated outer membrane protein [Vibrio hannami]
MDMATDTAMVRLVKGNKGLILGSMALICFDISAADVEFMPFVDAEYTYTSNIDQLTVLEQSSDITTLGAGLIIDSQGNDGNLSLDYSAKKLFYSHDSERNKSYNDLSFNADKVLVSEVQLRGDVGASIANIASNIENNASDDLISGNTIETRNFVGGLSYQSNPRSYVDLNTRVNATATRNEDDEGDSNGFGVSLSLNEGDKITQLFWSTNYDYATNESSSGGNRTEKHIYRQKIGMQQVDGWSPFLNFDYEDYNGQGASDSANSSNVGPGVRYYWHQRSYAEVSYEFDLEDNDDFLRGAVYLNPTQRTTFSIDYRKRFYGDAYELALSHRNRRLTNEISYEEEVESFGRPFFIEGNEIEEFLLYKTLSWQTSLDLRRSSASVEIRTRSIESLNNSASNKDSDSYGSTLEFEYNITRKVKTSLSFGYDFYEFEQGEAPHRKTIIATGIGRLSLN